MSIFVIDQYFLILQVVYGFIIDIVDGVGVVECIGRRFLPENESSAIIVSSAQYKTRNIMVEDRTKLYPFLIF